MDCLKGRVETLPKRDKVSESRLPCPRISPNFASVNAEIFYSESPLSRPRVSVSSCGILTELMQLAPGME